jgi:hypothetical protein
MRNIIGLFLVTLCMSLNACPITGVFTYEHGCDNIDGSSVDMYITCLEKGGYMPMLLIFHDGGGYGTIVYGYDKEGDRVVSASAGHKSCEEAEKVAIEKCMKSVAMNVVVFDEWFDEWFGLMQK